MSLNADEEELYAFGMQAIPSVFRDSDRVKEDLRAMAKMAGATKAAIAHWLDMAMIDTATGPDIDPTDPDWLQLHAEDRGTRRGYGETTPVMRQRLINVPDGVTRASILAAAQALVTSSGVAGTVNMVELPRDGMFLGATYAADTSGATPGMTFGAPSGTGLMQATPLKLFVLPPYVAGLSGRVKSVRIVIANATNAGNNGTFTITGLVAPTSVQYVNFAGVAGLDNAATWTVQRLNFAGQVMEGAGNAYLGRGNRWSSRLPTMVIILPFGTSASIVASVKELARQKKAAGVTTIVEARTA